MLNIHKLSSPLKAFENIILAQQGEYIDSGEDGDLYRLGDKIHKILNKEKEYPLIDEASISCYFKREGDYLEYHAILPVFYNVASFEGYPVIIREELNDVIDTAHEDIRFNDFISRFIDQAILETMDYSYLFNRDKFMQEWKQVDFQQDWIKTDEVLDLAEALYNIIYDGIIPQDICLSNLGRDKKGILKIRDFSKFQITVANQELINIYNAKEYLQKDVFQNRNAIKQTYDGII